ncbi:MAG TPA: ChbG/HpnK family deacetylase [Gemmataceae bacterium]|nr:ChbG/HpnK family deacetylase [Gemmataceae bacterium]
MTTPAQRLLLVTADDFGIGPDTSRGILELGKLGVVTSTVLLVNSPFAAEGVAAWRAAGHPLELGWHPCLTIDAPVLPPDQVPSLVNADGRFPRLGQLLKRIVRGRVNTAEVEAEWRAQFRRFVEMVGHPPANVNAHHHVHIFRPIGEALARILPAGTFVRRVVEPRRTLRRVPGARLKRAFLSHFGKKALRRQEAAGFPGNDTLAGITDPPFVHAPDFFARWLAATPGRFVELSCHPGHFDPTLDGRDGTIADGHMHRRARELELLREPAFRDAVRDAGFRLVTAAEVVNGGCCSRRAA